MDVLVDAFLPDHGQGCHVQRTAARPPRMDRGVPGTPGPGLEGMEAALQRKPRPPKLELDGVAHGQGHDTAH